MKKDYNYVIKCVIAVGLAILVNIAVGFLFNNTLFNTTTSSGVIFVSGTSCARALTKAFMSPFPTCKILYLVSGTLNGVSTISSCISVFSSSSALYSPLSMASGSLGYCCSVAARGCNAIGDCLDPSAGLTAKGADKCIDLATQLWS